MDLLRTPAGHTLCNRSGSGEAHPAGAGCKSIAASRPLPAAALRRAIARLTRIRNKRKFRKMYILSSSGSRGGDLHRAGSLFLLVDPAAGVGRPFRIGQVRHVALCDNFVLVAGVFLFFAIEWGVWCFRKRAKHPLSGSTRNWTLRSLGKRPSRSYSPLCDVAERMASGTRSGRKCRAWGGASKCSFYDFVVVDVWLSGGDLGDTRKEGERPGQREGRERRERERPESRLGNRQENRVRSG